MTRFAAVLSFLLVLGCRCDDDRPDPPPGCDFITEAGACATINSARCDLGEQAALCPSDIAPSPDSGCAWAGLCEGMALALYCCDPATTSTATPGLPPFPPYPGDAACRPMSFPGSYGCLPAWFTDGLKNLPGGCGSCDEVGEEAWICQDAVGSHPDDCLRLGDAPYQDSGFYCCACTI